MRVNGPARTAAGPGLSNDTTKTLTKERQRAAKLGRKYSAEHREAIAAGLRRYHAAHPAAPRGRFKAMTEQERADYLFLTQRIRYAAVEALAAIGRADLAVRARQ